MAHVSIEDFVAELSTFATRAEATLKHIEADLEGNKDSFSVFSEMMVAIRGAAETLEQFEVSKIAGLGEELAVKGRVADSRPKIRKCVGALWDAVTTVKYLLEHHTEPSSEEHGILINRLESTLQSMGGARPSLDASAIEALLKNRT
jgi:hypothetical protein